MSLEVFSDNVDVNDGSYVTITPTVGEIWAIRGIGLANQANLSVSLDGAKVYDPDWGGSSTSDQESMRPLQGAVLFAASTAVLRFDNGSGTTNYVAHYSGVKIPSTLGASCGTAYYSVASGAYTTFAPGAGYVRVVTFVSNNHATLDDPAGFSLTDGSNPASLFGSPGADYNYGYGAQVKLFTTPNIYLRVGGAGSTTNGVVSCIDLPDTLFGSRVKSNIATIVSGTIAVQPGAGEAWLCTGFTVAGYVTDGTYTVPEIYWPGDTAGISCVLTTSCYLEFAGADASKHLYSAVQIV